MDEDSKGKPLDPSIIDVFIFDFILQKALEMV